MKEYTLLLDESGNFASDTNSLLAGFLYEGSPENAPLCERQIRQELLNNWRYAMTEQKTDSALYKAVRHLVEFKKDADRPKPDTVFCGRVTAFLEKIKDAVNGKYVVYQNDGTPYARSEEMYFNLLINGLTDTVEKLTTRGEAVKLYVLLGKRGRGVYNTDTINKSDYLAEIHKRWWKILEEKHMPLVSDSIIDPSVIDDKEDARGVVCDYIANTYFTRNSKLFYPYKETIEGMIDKEYKFVFEHSPSKESIVKYLNNDMFGSALVEYCYGYISHDEWKLALTRFSDLSLTSLQQAYKELDNLLRNVVTNQRNFPKTKDMIDRAFFVSNYIAENNGKYKESEIRNQIEFSLYLFLGTMNSHKGYHKESAKNLEEAEIRLEGIREVQVWQEYTFMFRNRLALCKEYSYDLKGAHEICQKLERTQEAYLSLFDDAPPEGLRMIELGKLYGTHAQIKLNMLNNGFDVCECDVTELAEKAMGHFDNENDKMRQYQTLADLKADCGEIDEALEYLRKGAGFAEVGDLYQIDYNRVDSFILYHLSKIGLSAIKQDPKSEVAGKILRQCDKAITALLGVAGNESLTEDFYVNVMPNAVSAYNFLLMKLYDRKTSVKKRLEELVKFMERENIAFTLPLYAEILLCEKKYNKAESRETYQTLLNKFDRFKNQDFPEWTVNYFDLGIQAIDCDDVESIAAFAKKRLY